MKYTQEQIDILKTYTDNLEEVTTIGYATYVRMTGKESTELLEKYHVIWFPEDRGNYYLVPKK